MELASVALEALGRLARIDEDLAYLALLTSQGLKPLSRYEKPLTAKSCEDLEALGLCWATHERLTDTGCAVEETVMSRHRELIEVYRTSFAGRPLRIDRRLGLLEGYLFGFPPCCVLAYLDRPYAANDLPAEDQAILFHWACPGCRITPLLVPRYQRALQALQSMASCDKMAS